MSNHDEAMGSARSAWVIAAFDKLEAACLAYHLAMETTPMERTLTAADLAETVRRELRPCRCGKPVRMGVMRIKWNRKQGVAHWIEHADYPRLCDHGQWETSAFKPYPKREEDKEYFKLRERWNAATADSAATVRTD